MVAVFLLLVILSVVGEKFPGRWEVFKESKDGSPVRGRDTLAPLRRPHAHQVVQIPTRARNEEFEQEFEELLRAPEVYVKPKKKGHEDSLSIVEESLSTSRQERRQQRVVFGKKNQQRHSRQERRLRLKAKSKMAPHMVAFTGNQQHIHEHEPRAQLPKEQLRHL
uniref:Uncharacterized protein n=1 Tax=Sexangularia sp. CB-2014 TaxID=1486929 RepID=A0A6U0JMM7_9EUKA